MAERKRRRSDSTGSKLSVSSQMDTSESTSPSLISKKSKTSTVEQLPIEKSLHGSAAPTLVSMKSDRSKFQPLNFRKAQRESVGEPPSCVVCKNITKDLVQVFCGHWTCKRCLSSERETSGSQTQSLCQQCEQKPGRSEDDIGEKHPLKAKKRFKEEMQRIFFFISEGNGDQQSPLQNVYTELYVTMGESGGQGVEHELTHSKPVLKKMLSFEKAVNLNEIFKPSPGQEKPKRTVVTKGIAGIGKSFAVQKFILDWAKREANQDTDFVFCFAFREMNLSKGEKSLYQLLTEFHPALCELEDSENYVQTKIIVILDGLDESRLKLDFDNHKVVTSVNTVTSLGNLLVNLIQGNLLPNANLWITSRPAALSQIPAKYIDVVTEIRGFNEEQKEEYFRRRYREDLSLAERIIAHVQSSLSLNIMCQIPIFCWISAVLFEEVFRGDADAEIPQTLTEMMAHFLFVQTKRRSRKYERQTEDNNENLMKTHRGFLLKLGKLAFVHLQKNNLIFYEEDLADCGIDVKEASVYSGFCNAVLKEEKLFSQKKMFLFVHLTVQEFFAALYFYDCLVNNNKTELNNFLSLTEGEETLLDLLKLTVDKVMEKKNGHLDFFLRFLLGLMVEHNRRVLLGLLTSPEPDQETNKKILTYLKSMRRKKLSPDSCISLFQDMVEMRDHKIKDEIQEYLKLKDRSKTDLSLLHCSALAYMLQVSKDDLELLDLKSYHTSEEGRRRLIPAVRSSKKAVLADCNVTSEWIGHLVSALKFPYSLLRDLDLSNNDLKDHGVELLCGGLSSPCCRLRILSLSGCLVTEEGCDHLASALKSNPSHLMELDLSYNHPGDSGEKLLSKLTNDSHYKLRKVNVEHGGTQMMTPGIRKYACKLSLDPNTAHKNLRLSEENTKVTWVENQHPYPHHRERFDQYQQVLCQQGLNGRCYFELEVLEPFNIGLTYRTIERKGDSNDCKLGHNDKSWSLTCSDDGFYVMHGDEKVSVASHCSRSSRVAVFLDWPAGTLSFYRVSSDSRTRLHTFKTEYSQPLYPAFELYTHSYIRFCH